MAGVGKVRFSISAEVRAAKRAYARLGSFFNTKQLAEGIGLQQVRWIDRNFRDEGTIEPWKLLLSTTIERKFSQGKIKGAGGRGYKILQDTGRLKASFSAARVTRSTVAVGPGSSVKYASAHEYGNHKMGLDARPMLPPKDVAEADAARLINAMIQRETSRVGF